MLYELNLPVKIPLEHGATAYQPLSITSPLRLSAITKILALAYFIHREFLSLSEDSHPVPRDKLLGIFEARLEELHPKLIRKFEILKKTNRFDTIE